MMKSKNKLAHYGALVQLLACSCILGQSITAIAQTEEQPTDELAPIVLEDRTFIDDPLFGPEFVEDADDMVSEDEASVTIPDDDPQEETYEQKLQRLFFAYREAVHGGMFAEADTLAKEIVELSIEVNGLDSRKSATALTNLAVAQHGMEDYTSAILNYTAAIGIIERLEDMLAADLVNPLRGLGAAYFGIGRPDLAKNAFDRAIHISHVNDGPHNLDQIEILMSLAETFLSVGETKNAVDIQKRIFYLQARNIAADSMDIIPALHTRAAWQRRMHAYEEERFTWRRIIKIVERENGKESLELIDPLTSIANSYLTVVYINLPMRSQPGIVSGEPYLKRAVRISERNPDSTLQIRVDAKIELADYHVLTDRASRGHKLYREVWNLLSEDETLLAMRANLLESARLLRGIHPPVILDDEAALSDGSMPEGYLSGTVVFSYTTNTRGRTTNVKLVEADPAGLDDLYRRIGRELRFIVHRPRLVDGNPIETTDLTFSHDFFYQDEELVDEEEESQMVTETAAAN